MQYMRRALTKKLTAGLAIAATLMHVAALSLHVAMIAGLALAGNAMAGERPARLVICTPAPRTLGTADAQGGIDSDTSDTSGTTSATVCPVCTSGANPALVLPDAVALTVRVANAQPTAVAVTPATVITRHEARRKQCRGPPHLV